MKMKLTLMVALAIGMHAASNAYTLDAVGYEGGALRARPVSMCVAGYGEVVFESAVEPLLVVHSAYQNDPFSDAPELGFDPQEAVKIVFKGQGPTVARSSAVCIPIENKSLATLTNQEPGARLEAANATADTIPETASNLLGILGVLLLFLRRGR